MSAGTERRKIELVRSMWDAIERRDLDAFLDLFTEDAELRSAWSTIEGVGPYRGRAGLKKWWTSFLLETVDTYEGEVEQAISVDDVVVALVRVHGEGAGSGFRISRVVGQLFRLDGDRISRLSVHLDPADAFTEAGTELARRLQDG